MIKAISLTGFAIGISLFYSAGKVKSKSDANTLCVVGIFVVFASLALFASDAN